MNIFDNWLMNRLTDGLKKRGTTDNQQQPYFVCVNTAKFELT